MNAQGKRGKKDAKPRFTENHPLSSPSSPLFLSLISRFLRTKDFIFLWGGGVYRFGLLHHNEKNEYTECFL